MPVQNGTVHPVLIPLLRQQADHWQFVYEKPGRTAAEDAVYVDAQAKMNRSRGCADRLGTLLERECADCLALFDAGADMTGRVSMWNHSHNELEGLPP